MLTTRTMIILSAVAATGIVFLTQPSHSEQTVGVDHAKLQDRHPAFNIGGALREALSTERGAETAPAPDFAPKSDKLNIVGNCASYTWPRIPAGCLELAAESDDSHAPRQVTIKSRPDDRISIVTPAATIVAQR